VASTALSAGADWLHVFSIAEGVTLRRAGIDAPILVLGPPEVNSVGRAVDVDLRLTVSGPASAETVASAGAGTVVHLKLETGTNRQGLRETHIKDVISLLKKNNIVIEGAYTHFADIEDTTDHAYAESQLCRFETVLRSVDVSLPHTACSAAAILFPETYFEMVRVGIALYGLWPSGETHVSAKMLGRNALELAPVMTWKTRVTEVNTVPSGEYVGYGRTFRTTRTTRIAVLPVGYADGFDRGLSNVGHVLIRGVRAPICGRICMNLSMVDVTDISGVTSGDEAVIIGRQGNERISAETMAKLLGTINYEVVTRAAPSAPRILVD
jgi:alanine racemase